MPRDAASLYFYGNLYKKVKEGNLKCAFLRMLESFVCLSAEVRENLSV